MAGFSKGGGGGMGDFPFFSFLFFPRSFLTSSLLVK